MDITTINYIIMAVGLIIGIITFFIGLKITLNCSGNLKKSVLFIMILLITILIHQIVLFFSFINNITGNVIGFLSIVPKTSLYDQISFLIVVLSLFFSAVYMNKAIESIAKKNK